MAFAELELDEVKVYVNDERDFDVDEDGGEIDVERGDNLEIRAYLDNNRNNDTEIKLRGIIRDIDDGDDETEERDYTLHANETEEMTRIFMTIPDDAILDDYDFDLIIEYKYSGEGWKSIEVDFDIIVKGDELEKIELEDVMRNMSVVCSNVISQMTQTFDYINRYDNVSTSLSTCREERGTYQTQASEKEKTLIQCQTDRNNYQNDEKECNNKIEQMISKSDCKVEKDDEIKDAVEKAEKKKDNTMIGLLGGAAIIGYVMWRRKKGVAVHDKVYEEKVIP